MEDIYERLIEAVHYLPYLYDTGNENYKNRKLKDDAWQQLSEDFGIDAKDTWRKLRDCHRDALRKRQLRALQDGKPQKRWKYEDQMEFLIYYMKNRPTDPKFQPNNSSQMENAEEEINSFSLEISEPSCSYREPLLKRKRKLTDDPILEFLKKSEEGRETRHLEVLKALTSSKEDPLDIFFKGMCEATKRLPKRKQSEIKRILFSAVQDAEDSMIDEEEAEKKE